MVDLDIKKKTYLFSVFFLRFISYLGVHFLGFTIFLSYQLFSFRFVPD